MELERYHELRTRLQQWKTRLAENIRRQIESTGHWLARLRTIYNNDGADEDFTIWLDRWCRQAAIQFILRILFLRVLEDRGLLGTVRIRSTDGQKMWSGLTRNLGAASYVRWCCQDAARLLPDLFGPTEYDLILPEDELVQRFLDEVWRRPDPNRGGWLRFDFRAEPEKGGEGFQTRFIGDLYQELDAEIRERYALLQTPPFISQFILEHTLLRSFEDKDYHEVTLIDPTCGSGHFLIDAFWLFVAKYEGTLDKTHLQLGSKARIEIAQTIIERHLFGCDINPYAVSLTRFRLTLAICDYAQPTLLQELRNLQFNIVVVDSLTPYERIDTLIDSRVGSQMQRFFGQPEAIKRALPVLQRRYDVVIGNPPYIFEKLAAKRKFYSTIYKAASGKFGLAAPFTERFLQLSVSNGYVGLINSNAFARRQFGRSLVEKVLPKYDLTMIVDLSGAYIPGHGTPTLMLFARSRAPRSAKVKVVSCSRAESKTPIDPRQGLIWKNIEDHYQREEFQNSYITVTERPRRSLATHPWILDNRGAQILLRLEERKLPQVADLISHPIGILAITGADEIFLLEDHVARRLRLPARQLMPLVIGEEIRDWQVKSGTLCLLPYDRESFEVIGLDAFPSIKAYLEAYRWKLEKRIYSGSNTMVSLGYRWYELPRFSKDKLETHYLIAQSFVATHNHFALESREKAFKQSAPIIKLRQSDRVIHVYITAILNSSAAGFLMKQICFDKRAGRQPVRDTYYEFSGSHVEKTPLPRTFDKENSQCALDRKSVV